MYVRLTLDNSTPNETTADENEALRALDNCLCYPPDVISLKLRFRVKQVL